MKTGKRPCYYNMLLLSGLLLCLLTASIQPAQAECAVLKGVSQIDVYKIPQAEIAKCIENGNDPTFELMKEYGRGFVQTEVGNTLRTSTCDPSGVCLNTRRERSEPVEPFQPHQNPSLRIPELPWKDASIPPQLPCGAVGPLAMSAVYALLGNVNIKIPPQASSLVNTYLSGLLGSLFKNKNCQDGSFWGILNTLATVILPRIGSGGASFVFDIKNNTFLAPPDTMLAFPQNATFTVDLSTGGARFNLPAGGYFYDTSGQKIEVLPKTQLEFTSQGQAITSTGQMYSIPKGGMVTFNPRGLIALPTGVRVPVPPDSTLFPMGPVTRPPEWAKKEPASAP